MQDWICFMADGRAEEGLGKPVVVTRDREGFLASGHVGRVKPRNRGDLAWIWTAMVSENVQAQLAARACGSVVDALYEPDIASVALPPPLSDRNRRAVNQAWAKFPTPQRLRQPRYRA
jgi:hypothetical protein